MLRPAPRPTRTHTHTQVVAWGDDAGELRYGVVVDGGADEAEEGGAVLRRLLVRVADSEVRPMISSDVLCFRPTATAPPGSSELADASPSAAGPVHTRGEQDDAVGGGAAAAAGAGAERGSGGDGGSNGEVCADGIVGPRTFACICHRAPHARMKPRLTHARTRARRRTRIHDKTHAHTHKHTHPHTLTHSDDGGGIAGQCTRGGWGGGAAAGAA